MKDIGRDRKSRKDWRRGIKKMGSGGGDLNA